MKKFAAAFLILLFLFASASAQVPKGKGYVINVAAYKHGVGSGAWNHIDGSSEAVLAYIQRSETIV